MKEGDTIMKRNIICISRLIALALVLALSMSLAACGKSPATDTPSVSGDAPAAQNIGFPTDGTIELVVPGKAGGGSDLGIRYYSEGLSRIYGLKNTVTNYDSNTIGHATVAAAAPDGHTLTVATSALMIQYVTGNSEVNPIEDFTLIACLQDNGFSCLAAPADAPYDNFDEFVTYALAHPGELNAGMPSSGSNTFLFGKLTKATGIELNAVECASESDRLTNLAGGFIDIGVVGIGNARDYEAAGKLKVIGTVAADGVTIAQYPEELPENYKTLQEQGYKDCYMMVYHYLLGPAGMDETMVAEINAAMEAVANDETVHSGIAGIGNIPGWHNLEDSRAIRDAEYNQVVEIAKTLGLYAQG